MLPQLSAPRLRLGARPGRAYHVVMTDQQTDPGLNGQARAPAADGACEDCATGGEKILALLAAAIGLGVLFVAVDMFTGGRLSGVVREQVSAAAETMQAQP